MTEAFGVAASALAVAELSVKIISQCLQYSRGVKHAKDDIERVLKEVGNWETVMKETKDLLDSHQGIRLQTSQKLCDALEGGQSQLKSLLDKLTPGKRRQAMTRFGIRALKWPFNSKEVENILQDLARCMQLITTALQLDQTVAVLTIDQKAVLRTLPEAARAAFDSHAEEHNPTCLPDTRVDLLREISQWVEDPDVKTIFWLNGMAGTGKSTISRTLARSSYNRGQLGASFFFKRGEGDRGGVSKFFTTIAAQLIRWEPALTVHVKDAIDADPAICNKRIQEQFEKLVHEPLAKLSTRDRKPNVLVLVIDALDECDRDEDVELIIQLLSRANASKSSRLRIFLTSRPELPIQLGFNTIQGTYQDFLLHGIPKQVVEHDLSIYFEHELAKIRDKYNRSVSRDRQLSLSWPEPSKTQILVHMAIPLFIFAVTVCRFLNDRKGGNPDQQLQTVLQYRTRSQESKLDATYLPVLNRMLDGLSQRETTKAIQDFRDIIGPIVILASPLSTSALERMLNIEHRTIETRLDWLHSVLSIPPSRDIPVRLLHLSFRDFLLDPEKQDSSPFWINEKEAHEQLAANCLRVMSETLCKNICKVKWPGTPHVSIDPQIITDKLPPEVQYACQYWVYHVQQAGRDLLDDNQVYGFLKQHFLHWLEALSLIGRASESLQDIGILQSLLQSEGSSQVSRFINDALRFARTNVSVLQAAPLQAYCSALAFAPEESIVRNVFQSNIPGWISLRPQVNIDWSSCLQTLEGHTGQVGSVAFSPDGGTLASASDDQTVRVWSARTGDCLQMLEGHTDWVRSVAFSPDGDTLASASDDKTVRVWSARTGDCLQMLEGHTDPVRSVVFSPDGGTLASASGDQTVRVRSARTGDCLQMLEGHTDWVRSVAFSPDGDTLASASDDKTVRVWSARTGDCLQTLEGHTGQVRSVAFSPDGGTLASASDDETVRVWSARTGDCLQTLEGHTGWVGSVAFSPDGDTLASASDDKTVRVWSARTGDCLQMLEGHTGQVGSVAFSPDGGTLASASGDQTVRVWSARTGDCLQMLEGHTDPVRSVVFSPDGGTLASVSGGKTVRIWSACTGDCLQTLEGHIGWVRSVAFSPDGGTLASASDDETVRVWSARTGDCLQTLEGHTGQVGSVVFSPDGSTLASVSGGKTVRVWSAATGECLPSIDFGTVSTLSFDPDGRSLLTQAGAISLNPLSAVHALPYHNHDHERRLGYGISSDRCWITLNGKGLLWLPADYRPGQSAVFGPTVAIGTSSGRIVIMRFSAERLIGL